MPLTPGHEWSGYVAEMGDAVEGVEIGDLVVGDISIGCGKCKNCKKGRKDKNALHFMQNGRIIYANDCVDYMNMHP